MPGDYTDNELIAQVLQGQKNSFSMLVRRYQQPAYKLSLVVLQHPADAEDAVGEAFVKAYQALPRCREGTNFKSWFLKITYNCCQDILRRRKKYKNYTNLEDFRGTVAANNPLQTVINLEERQVVWLALSQLDIDDRTAVVMKYYHGSSYRDISDTLNWPLGTVASRLNRAREKLRQVIKGGGEDE